MPEVLTIKVQARDPQKNKGTGSRVSRRLRAKGQVPAIIYGHKQAPQPIAIHRDDVALMIKKGAHLAQLQLPDSSEMVLVRDVQWDHLGNHIIHLDFTRVSAEETVHTQVNLHLHGTAPGTSEGGHLEVLVHSVDVVCHANAIPDGIRVDVSELHVGGGIHVRDLVLPDGVKATADPDLLLIQVVHAGQVAEEVAPAEGTPAEPEVIGRKAEAKEGDEKDKDKEKKK